MEIEIDGSIYHYLRGSDVIRDGMYLEVSFDGGALIEVFYSDVTNKMSVTCFAEDIPLELLEATLAKSRVLLPPAK